MEATRGTIALRCLGQVSVNLERISGSKTSLFPEGKIAGVLCAHIVSFSQNHLLGRIGLRLKRKINFLFPSPTPQKLFLRIYTWSSTLFSTCL